MRRILLSFTAFILFLIQMFPQQKEENYLTEKDIIGTWQQGSSAVGSVALLGTLSCSKGNQKTENIKPETSLNNSNSRKDTLTLNNQSICISEFRDFRNSIYQRKMEDVKKHFDFPLYENNLWSLAQYDDQEGIDSNHEQGFSGQDFYKYYDKLFIPEFITCLLKIKSEELFTTGKYRTPYFIETEKNTGKLKYWMQSIYEAQTGYLRLQFNTEEYENNEKESETLIEYIFKYDKNCNLKFEKLDIAG